MSSPFSTGGVRSRIEGVALLAVLALLGVLAVMQHQWLGALAEGERRKLTEDANEKVSLIARDIDRELTKTYLELRLDSKTVHAGTSLPARVEAPAFAEQLEKWRADSPHAGLVKDIFMAERKPDGPVRLLKFDRDVGAFVEESWPEVLQPVRRAIETGPEQALGMALPMSLPIATLPPPIMADVPALTAPVIDVVFSERRREPRELPRGGVGQVRQMLMRHTGHGPIQILLLDPAYLREKLVTSVASSRVDSESPFEWSVVKGDGTHVAGAAFDARADKADASAPVLRLRMDELDKSLLRGVLPGLGKVISDSSVRFVVQMSSSTSTISVNGGTTPSTAPWTLRLRHRSGSIDAAVLSQQRRNSALSASVLGVLGLSAGMVFFSARRLRATATQQVEFVAAVSHELRTPLAVIRSAADNLADGVVEGRDQAKRYGALIRNESVRLADMVEHVLEFAGADSAGRAARGSIDAVEAARGAVKAMESLAAERNAEVSLDAPLTLLSVNGDLSHLTRAISNLIGNALKYGGDAPRVTVRVARGAHGVEISVADQGSGLEASEIPRLFEPFYRGHRASEAQIPGSGLGLALVKRIVESHGGRVTARNNPEGGALFTIALPAL